jgi:hypothetical protein
VQPTKFFRRALQISGVAAALLAALPSVPAYADAPRTLLTRNVVPGIERATPTGAAAPQTLLHLNVTLRRPDPAGEAAFLKAVNDPRSAQYRDFLSPRAFDARFGVSPQAYERAVDWLRGGGLQVTEIPGSRTDLLATGPAAKVGDLLHVAIRTYPGGLVANDQAPSVPADVPVLAITGLTNREQRHLATPRQPAGPVVPGATGVATGTMTARDLWSMYELPAGNMGEGQSMAIFLWGKTDGVLDNLRAFEVRNRLAQVPLVKHYYGTDTLDTAAVDQQEADLDLQASSGMAPNVQGITMYMGQQGSDTDLIAAVNAWVDDPNGAKQGSASYSGCEEMSNQVPSGLPAGPGDAVFQPAFDQALAKAVAEGRTFFTSSGDSGSSCPFLGPATVNGVTNDLVPLAAYPAASPYAVGVGGTVIYGDGSSPQNRSVEYSWTHTGGGTSFFVAAPDYQQGVTAINGHCLTQPDGSMYASPAPICRGTPDVAAISGDLATNDYEIVENGTPGPGGGTSLSSPLWAGMWARMNAAAPARNGQFPGLGFANPLFYAIGADSTRYANAFNDIQVGANGYYTALPGWDYVSGWGTPKLSGMMKDLAGATAPTNPLPAPFPAPAAGLHFDPCAAALFTDPAGDDSYVYQGQQLSPVGGTPQLDILQGALKLSDDRSTLQFVMTLKDLSTTIPTGGGENDYRILWQFNGATYFALATVEPGGSVLYLDGTTITAGSTTRYQFLHNDSGTFTPGPKGTIEIDVPLANVGTPDSGGVLSAISGEADVREGTAQAGLLATVDQAAPRLDFAVGLRCATVLGGSLPGGSAPVGNALQSVSAAAASTLPNTARDGVLGGAASLGVVLVAAGARAMRRRRTRRA